MQPSSRHSPRVAAAVAQCDDLGVPGGVGVGLTPVAAGADDLTGGVDHHGPDGYVGRGERRTRLLEGLPHRGVPRPGTGHRTVTRRC